MMRAVLCVSMFLCLCSSRSFAEPIPQFSGVSPDTWNTLVQTGEIRIALEHDSSWILAASHPFSAFLSTELAVLEPTDGIQVLFFLPEQLNLEQRDRLYLKLYNLMQTISTMKGITYYSQTASDYRVLFEDAFTISDQGSGDPVPDHVFLKLPEESRSFAFFRDSRFGDFKAEIVYRSYADCLTLSMTNITPLYILQKFKVVDERKLQIHIAVFPTKEGFYLYGVSFSDMASIPGFRKGKGDSLYNRLKALYDWFRNRYVP